jgi:hypothetical protein
MTLNLSICTSIIVASAAMPCDSQCPQVLEKFDKTKDWKEEVTLVVSSEVGTVYDMDGEPSEGIKYREEGKSEWNPAYFWEIEGFNYVKGFEYWLKVEKTHLANPPQDASSIRYKLLEVISEENKIAE